MRVAFIHPDLGIGMYPEPYFIAFPRQNALGGAERLVVDAALGLQRLGHTVHIYTSHHDPGHCFEETKDGMNSVMR